MLRRIGYGLGLLFVLACVAAYPLTWGRCAQFAHPWRERLVGAAIDHGLVEAGFRRLMVWDVEAAQADVSDSAFARRLLYEVRIGRMPADLLADGWIVTFPLWLPAVITAGFMAWRWRRRRTRRGAGFPVAHANDGVKPFMSPE
jgi:hypothetical protein